MAASKPEGALRNPALRYLRNVALWALNNGLMTVIGKDPRMTISAMVFLHDWQWVVTLIGKLRGNPDHCRIAAQGWNDPAITDMSIWRHKPKG